MFFEFSPKIAEAAKRAEELITPVFAEIDKLALYNGQKVLRAFIDNNIQEMHLKGTTGYGYDDSGRDALDRVYAEAFGAEDALVRHNFVNGTHALVTALFGILRPGDLLLCVTGEPYDTLRQAIFGETGGSLKEFGIRYAQIELLPDGSVDMEEVSRKAPEARMVYIQRSRGYSLRPSLTVDRIGEIVKAVRESGSKSVIMVDNCYGEFSEYREPTQVGVDLIAGSLIKNPGGGIASTGGYIAGKRELVELCACRLTAPGVGKEVGCTLEQNREMYMGFFRAPEAVAAALKTGVFASALFEELGYQVSPKYGEYRTDIITAIQLGSPEKLCAFCRGIQKASPIDSSSAPEPWDMPGYGCKVIMAAGCFTMGSSIELSADAPLREPYAVWMQGGTSYPAGKTGVMSAAMAVEGL